MSEFETVATELAPTVGAATLRVLADRVREGWPEHAVLADVGSTRNDEARRILHALAAASTSREHAAGFLRGLAAGYAAHSSSVSVETVWSGPGSHSVPVRATAQALTQVVQEATDELLLMTYSAKRNEPLRQALVSAIERGVRTTVVVETLRGAGSALAGAEPAAAFADIRGLRLWHWPVGQRGDPGSKMHAKLAVADRSVLLVSSANLTQSGTQKNIEAGILIRGGTAPARAAEHILELRSRDVLQRLSVSSEGLL